MHKAAVQDNLQSRHVLEGVGYIVLQIVVMYAAPKDYSNLVWFPEAVVYFVKLDCSPCMFVLFTAHACEVEYRVQHVVREQALQSRR